MFMDAADSLFVVRSLLIAINVYDKFMLAQIFYLQWQFGAFRVLKGTQCLSWI